MKVFINNRDNLERGFRRILEWLTEGDGVDDIVIIDNQSTWPPLLSFYQKIDTYMEVIRVEENLGPYAFWELGLHKQQTERFIVTDPDLVPSELCPSAKATITEIERVMQKYIAAKVGPSLSITNLPEYFSQADEVRRWEKQFWSQPVWETPNAPYAYYADIDTTFALYNPGSEVRNSGPILRLAAPYSFDHIPWFEDSSQPNPERDWYRAHARKDWTHW